jgi:hypothetical protein
MIRKSDIENDIELYKKYYDKVRNERNKLSKISPKGVRLRAARHGDAFQYYLRQNDDKTGIYIRKEKLGKVKCLAQIEYCEKLEQLLTKNLVGLEKLKDLIENDPFTCVEKKMSPGKYALVNPVYYNDSQFITKWIEQEYIKMEFREDAPEFYTRQGLRVRSKSEVIIADMLDEMDIPFLYEKPLKLGTWTIHPDFTLMDIKNRREIYWEHFGMMDDMDYRNDAFLKMRRYEECGFYQCDSLIWTFETGKHPLNTKALRRMIMQLAKTLGYENKGRL